MTRRHMRVHLISSHRIASSHASVTDQEHDTPYVLICRHLSRHPLDDRCRSLQCRLYIFQCIIHTSDLLSLFLQFTDSVDTDLDM